MTTATKMHPAFEAFYHSWRGKTPANAIRLAIADHEARGNGIGDFVSALRQAERIVEADAERDKVTAALFATLREIAECDVRLNPTARVLVAKARKAIANAEAKS